MGQVRGKFAVATILAGALMVPVAVCAEGGSLSFNIGAVSFNKFEGIDSDSRTSATLRPAIQGGVDYEFGNGFYLGNWNSSGEFGSSDLEIDLYGGYRGELGQGVTYDVSFVRYLYPNSGGGWNGAELIGKLSYGIFTAKISRGMSGAIEEWSRLGLSVSQPLSDALTLKGGIGFRNQSNGNSGANDFSIGLEYNLGNGLSTSATVSGAQKSKVGDAGATRLTLGIVKFF